VRIMLVASIAMTMASDFLMGMRIDLYFKRLCVACVQKNHRRPTTNSR
jgi:hypothetical protein